MDFRFIAMILAGLFVAATASAEGDVTEEPFMPEGWEATGEVKKCVWLRRIRNTNVIDDYNY